MTFGQEFINLFTGMEPAVYICLIAGIIFVTIEMFQPGFGVFGVLGSVLLVMGIVFRLIKGDGNPLAQFFILAFLITIILGIVFLIMIRTMKKGWLSKTPIVENETAVSTVYSEGTPDFAYLIGKVGTATTPLRPSGKAQIEGESLDVVANGFFIQSGEPVTVVSVEGGKIEVKRAE